MRILYGVQGTGNGHISRARALNQCFSRHGLEVDYLFSGRDPERYFDMHEFGSDWHCHKGLTFAYQAGGVCALKTLRNNSIVQLRRDIRALDLSGYDLVLTDFEPITAHAARAQGVPSIGVGHQYAFLHKVPTEGSTFLSEYILRRFAPATYNLGLHWHHFGEAILPPIVHMVEGSAVTDEDKIVVYLGFEDPEDVIALLQPFTNCTFVIYGPYSRYQSLGHIQLKPLSRESFCADLASCNGVIANAGFELASESIQLGKKLLVKPLRGQMEQLSNARALADLGLAMVMPTLDPAVLGQWLENFHGTRIIYPDVADAIAQWISVGNWTNTDALCKSLWAQTHETRALAQRTLAPAA